MRVFQTNARSSNSTVDLKRIRQPTWNPTLKGILVAIDQILWYVDLLGCLGGMSHVQASFSGIIVVPSSRLPSPWEAAAQGGRLSPLA